MISSEFTISNDNANEKQPIRQQSVYEYNQSAIAASDDSLSLKPRQICIAWRNLNFQASNSLWSFARRKKTILNCLNGYFECGTLNALMGPSGAGKTTLLNCLAGNSVGGLTSSSEIYLRPVNKEDGGRLVSYFIQQHVNETIIGRLTVGEILSYAFRFKNGFTFSRDTMAEHIKKIMNELLLDERVHGRYFDQCSGGEQKRIAIAQELMALQPPALLFIDEPTTGLDSNAALLVMACLKQLINTFPNMTIITSIHTPSDEILNMFNRVYILAKGGVAIFSDRPHAIQSMLIEELSANIQSGEPPIEVLLKIACNGISDEQVIQLANKFQKEKHHELTNRLNEVVYYSRGVPATPKSFSFSDLFLLFCRHMKMTFVADYHQLAFQVLVVIFFLLTLNAIFRSDMVKPSGCYSLLEDAELASNGTCRSELESNTLLVQNLHYHGLNVIFFGFIAAVLSALFISPQLLVFLNEHRNQWYSLGTFFVVLNLISILGLLLNVMIISSFSYFYSKQYQMDPGSSINWTRFGLYFYFTWLTSFFGQTLGQMLGTILVYHSELSIVGTQIFMSALSLTNGYIVEALPENNIIKIIERLFIQKNLFHGFVWLIYGFGRCESETEYSMVLRKYSVDETTILSNSYYAFINIGVIKLVMLIYIFIKFTRFDNCFFVRCFRREPKAADGSALTLIDFNQKENANNLKSNEIYSQSITLKLCNDKEADFHKFSHQKISIAWCNLSLFSSGTIFDKATSVWAPKRNELFGRSHLILQHLNGSFNFGTLNALMGTSGAGKTTLLKVLNGRFKTRFSRETEIYLNRLVKIETCFITQDISGHLLPGLTARQALVYASRLKNGNLNLEGKSIDHNKISSNLLDELNIADIEHTPVERCSGGERKRLALALELTSLRMPNLICIDEPTSGLDSNSAHMVVACLQQLAHSHNVTIVTSIHQPNTDVFNMFDQIYVLARGGVAIYTGPPGQIESHLSNVPNIDIANCRFPIEHIMKYSSSTYPDSIVCQLVENSDLRFKKNIIDSGRLEAETLVSQDGIVLNRRRFSFADTWILCSRYFAYTCGHVYITMIGFYFLDLVYGLVIVNFFDSAIAGISGCINLEEDFNNTCNRSEAKLEEDDMLKSSFQYIFYSNAFFTFFVVLQCTLCFSTDVVYFYNEHRNGWFSTGSFYFMKCVFDIVPLIPLVIIYVYLTDIYEDVRPGMYFTLVIVLFLCCLAFQAIGQITAIISNGSLQKMSMLLISVFLIQAILSDFFIPVHELHYVFEFLSKFSIVRYGIQIIIVALYGFERCRNKEVQPFIYVFHLKDEDWMLNVQCLTLLSILFHLIALALLLSKANSVDNRQQRVKRIQKSIETIQPTKTIIPGMSCHHEFRIEKIEL